MDVNGASSLYITGYQGGNGNGDQPAGADATGDAGWNYTVAMDTDGDGSVDNSQTMTEAQLNEFLAPVGMKFVSGAQQSVDGFAVTPANGSIANDLSADPTVASPAGDRASPEVVQERLSALDPNYSSAGSLAWMALSEMARTSENERKTARELRDALQKGKFEEKQASLDAQASKIESEKSAAWVQFGAACGAAAVSLGGGFYGLGGGNAAMAQGIVASSSVISTGVTAADKTGGAQAEADAQELYSKTRDLEADKLDMYIDDASSNYQEAKQAHDKAIKMIEDFMQRKTDSLNAILRS